jgi:Zn-dependent protease
MDHRQNPLYLSFPLGTWFATSVWMSVFFPLVLLVLWSRLGWSLGTICCLLLLFSVLLHEFLHVFAARWTGGSADEILLWPAGGLAYCHPGPTLSSEILTIIGGPLANGLLCLATLPAVLSAGLLSSACHPIVLPPLPLDDTPERDLMVLLFALNIKLLYLNLLPVYPMDGGRLLQVLLAQIWELHTVRTVTHWTALGAAIVLGMAGYAVDPEIGIVLVTVSSLILIMNVIDFAQRQFSGAFDDSFLGYDFSQGYTSLERTAAESALQRKGILEEWRERRREKKRLRDEQDRAEAETRLDALLEKVHTQGIDALTDAERRFLKEASARYRNPGSGTGSPPRP